MKICFDMHTHTVASGHAFSTFKENVKEAAAKGLYAMGMSDHAPAMPGSAQEIYFGNFKSIRRELMGVKIYTGVEANIMDFNGTLDLGECTLQKMDYVIASLHVPCIRPGSPRENTDALIGAMKNPYVKIIGHPDDDRYPLEYDRLIPAALENRVALEVNTPPSTPDPAARTPEKMWPPGWLSPGSTGSPSFWAATPTSTTTWESSPKPSK